MGKNASGGDQSSECGLVQRCLQKVTATSGLTVCVEVEEEEELLAPIGCKEKKEETPGFVRPISFNSREGSTLADVAHTKQQGDPKFT